MTIEDDFLSIIQGTILIAAPILIIRTVDLWQGIVIGGLAKSQALIAFTTDPMTMLSAVICLAALLCFCFYAMLSRRFANMSNQE